MYENNPDTSTTTVDVFAGALHFDPSGHLRAGERRMAGGEGDWQLAMFHVVTDEDVHADHWEKHPAAEEAVCCLSGGVRVYLRATAPGTDDELVTLGAGEALVVPRDRWHRLSVDGPTDLMTVTHRDGTQLEPLTTA